MPADIGFDKVLIQQAIVAKALVGLRKATEYTLERARYHAPVRSIFKRTRRGSPIPTSWRTMRSEKRYQAFLASKARTRAVDITSVSETRSWARRQEVRSQMSGAPTSTRQPRHGTTGQFAGHRNSLIPVFSGRSPAGVPFRFTGDFRRFSAGKLMKVASVRQTSVQTREVDNPRGKVSIQQPWSAESMLSAQGRWELAHAGRGRKGRFPDGRKFTLPALFVGSDKKTRLGGRLRGELRIRGPERHAGSMWMYVESPTPYATYQEFGTSHNRPQPFLRPALYESRNILRFEVRKAVDRRFNTLPEEGGG